MSNAAVATRDDAQAIAPASETAAILQVIERAASNPNVDIDKMERLFAMRERMIAQSAKRAYLDALAVVQPLLPIIDRRGKITIRDKNDDKIIKQSTPYALWEDINEAITPVISAHGFSLSFRTGLTPEGKVTVTGILGHSEGHDEQTTITLPHDSTGSKNAVQAVGSSTSYGKRYAAMALLNITSRGEDDDGKSGGDEGPISAEQAKQIMDLISSTGSDIERFCAYLKTPSVAEIPASRFKDAIDKLNAKKVQRR